MIKNVNENNLKDFLIYCEKYGKEHDESYLPDSTYFPDKDHPSYILLDNNGEVIGAAALLLEEPFRKASKGRFIILHSIMEKEENYRELVNAALTHMKGLTNLYLFVPENKSIMRILESIGFTIERHSFVMERENLPIPSIEISSGYEFKPFDIERDLISYCKIINKAFANLAGHVDVTPDIMKKMISESNVPEDGVMLLWNYKEPVGLVFTEFEDTEDDCLYIGPVAVLPEYQGKGFGKALLRKGIEIGRSLNLRTCLSVNAENEKALSLYLREGFKKTDVRICYHMILNQS